MNKILLSLLVFLMLCSLGCVGLAHKNEVYYTASIEQVDLPEGVFITTRDGSAPMSYVYLRLHRGDKLTDDHLLEVQIMAKYDEARYGELEDEVSFWCSPLSPEVKAIDFKALIDYRVIKKKHPTVVN